MKLIAWDTSSKVGVLAALEWEQEGSVLTSPRLVAELSLNVDSTHSERLLWGIHQILESARWRLEDIDVFGVGVGPGSFTGLRIGITTARTLAHTFKKPLIGISSLSALARPVALNFSQKNFEHPTLVIAVTDACKGELFALWGSADTVASCTAAGSAALWNEEVEEVVISPSNLGQAIQKRLIPGTRWIAIGEGRQRYTELWEKIPADLEISLSSPLGYVNQVQGRFVGLLVWEAFQNGGGMEGMGVFPRYLRASDAELKLKAGLLPRAPSFDV